MSPDTSKDLSVGEVLEGLAQAAESIETDGNSADPEDIALAQQVVADLRGEASERDDVPETEEFLSELSDTLDKIETGTATEDDRERAAEKLDFLGTLLIMSAVGGGGPGPL